MLQHHPWITAFYSHIPTATVNKLRRPLMVRTEAEDAGVEDWELGAEVEDEGELVVDAVAPAANEAEGSDVEDVEEDAVLLRKELYRPQKLTGSA
jgi:hypothetical protein